MTRMNGVGSWPEFLCSFFFFYKQELRSMTESKSKYLRVEEVVDTGKWKGPLPGEINCQAVLWT